MMTPIDIAKKYLADDDRFAHMQDGDFKVDTHDFGPDLHIANLDHLPEVNASHVDETPYHVVTVAKEVATEDGAKIPKVVKLKIQNDKVAGVLESK